MSKIEIDYLFWEVYFQNEEMYYRKALKIKESLVGIIIAYICIRNNFISNKNGGG